MKKIVCIVILILAITGLLNGISYLISGISARGIGGVNYGRVIFPLLVGAIAVYFLKRRRKNRKLQVYQLSLWERSAEKSREKGYNSYQKYRENFVKIEDCVLAESYVK